MPLLRWLLPLSLLWLSGCSLTQFAYNRADTVVRWQVSEYLKLDTAQQAVFDEAFAELWQWHRHHELPAYAQALHALADTDLPVDQEVLTTLSQSYLEHWRSLLDAAAPIACQLGPTLEDAQAASILAAIDQNLAKYARTHVDPPPERQRRQTERQVRKQLERWLGTLSPEQRNDVRQWTQERVLSADVWLAYRRHWRETLAEILEARKAPSYCERVTALIVDGHLLWTEDQRAVFEQNRAQWLDLFERIGATASPAQQAHLKTRLRKFARELEQLASVAPSDDPELP